MVRLGALLGSAALLFVLWTAPAAGETVPFDADIGLDPGHSYVDVGAVGGGLREFEVNLDTAFRVKALLEARRYSVNLSRSAHSPVSAMNHPDPTERIRIEQEARIASVGRVRCYVSINFNGLGNPRLSGTETYYNPDNFGEQSYRLAEVLQRHMVSVLWEAGYQALDRGVKSDLLAGKPYGHFFSLRGPQPSATVEGLFLTNPNDADALWRDEIRQAIAEGYSRGISDFLAGETAAGPAERSEGEPNSL
jgi:N-acetylmuramoyl-L-alanine amidase